MKKAYILLTTSFIIIFISLTIGAYIKLNSNITSQEFQKDLATIRGYWAVYGAKEIDGNFSIPYHSFDGNRVVYEINATKQNDGTDYFTWEIKTIHSSIANDSVYRRTLRLHNGDSSEMLSYKLEEH